MLPDVGQERSVLGFGRPVALRCVASSDHRAVLIAENRIPADAVHLYRVPVPSSFSSPAASDASDRSGA